MISLVVSKPPPPFFSDVDICLPSFDNVSPHAPRLRATSRLVWRLSARLSQFRETKKHPIGMGKSLYARWHLISQRTLKIPIPTLLRARHSSKTWLSLPPKSKSTKWKHGLHVKNAEKKKMTFPPLSFAMGAMSLPISIA